MGKKDGKDKANGGGTIALNKRARHEYHFEEKFEAGLALQGWELKSIRAGRANITESYAVVRNGELFLFGAQITPLISASTHVVADDRRTRKLLLHRRETDIAALVATQSDLLDGAWPLLAAGGTLLYATCSILRAENAAQVEAFLARTPDATLEPLDSGFGHDTGYGRQRLPGEGGMDGFFVARLKKR